MSPTWHPPAPAQLTFAQPFILTLGHNRHVMAAAANSQADSRFTADAGNPTLAATQLLATLETVPLEGLPSSTPAAWWSHPPRGGRRRGPS